MINNKTFGIIVLTVIFCLLSVSMGVCASGTTYTYDNLDRLVEVTRPDGAKTYRAIYYDDQNLVDVTKESGYWTEYEYESFGNPEDTRLKKVSTPDFHESRDNFYYTVHGTTEYSYNIKGKILRAIISGEDRKGNNHTAVHLYTYDPRQFLETETHPEMNTFSSSYGNVSISYIRDMVGNITSKTDARGTTGYSYDNINRIRTVNYPDDTPDVTYNYDKDILWQMISTQSNGETLIAYTYGYWPDNKLYTRSYSIKGRNYQETFTYNELRNIQTITYPSSRVITYYYYGDGIKIDHVYDSVFSKNLVSNITYHPSSQISGYTYGDSTHIRTDIGYDIFHRPITINTGTAANTGSVTSLIYSYSSNDNVHTIIDNNNPDNEITLEHEGHDRLAYAYGPWGTLMYGYDYLDNRTEMTRITGMDVYVTTYGYANNRLASSRTILVGLTDITVNIPYDASGNITKSGNNELVYDNANRITHVAGVQAYWYDGNGDRIIKKDGGNTLVCHYGIAANVISETNESGQPLTDYIYLGSRIVAKDEWQ